MDSMPRYYGTAVRIESMALAQLSVRDGITGNQSRMLEIGVGGSSQTS